MTVEEGQSVDLFLAMRSKLDLKWIYLQLQLIYPELVWNHRQSRVSFDELEGEELDCAIISNWMTLI